jgi:hypothetical protein
MLIKLDGATGGAIAALRILNSPPDEADNQNPVSLRYEFAGFHE